MLRFGLRLKMRFFTRSMVYWCGILPFLINNPPFLINKVIEKYLDHKFSSNKNQLKDISDVYYFNLSYICNLSHNIKNKLLKPYKEFCKENFNINLDFNSFKIEKYFSYNNPIPNDFIYFLVYKFTCASCSSSYIGETCRHSKTHKKII